MNLDTDALLETFGYTGIWAIIFAESGILFGVLLPGDSLLVAAGIFAAHGHFNIVWMTFGCVLAALIGNLANYEQGRRWRNPFLEKHGKRIIPAEKITKTYELLKKYQVSGLIISRFLPVARTLSPFLAGVIQMKYAPFFAYSLIGAVIWGGGLPIVGYYVGEILPRNMVDLMVLPIVFFLIVAVLAPYAVQKFKKKR